MPILKRFGVYHSCPLKTENIETREHITDQYDSGCKKKNISKITNKLQEIQSSYLFTFYMRYGYLLFVAPTGSQPILQNGLLIVSPL